MSFAYRIDVQRRLVVLRPDTVPSLRDWENVLDRVASDPLFAAGFGVLSDRVHLKTEPDADYVRGSIAAIEQRSGTFRRTRWAILTSHLPTYGMGRMAEAYAENRDIELRVFTVESEALDWLAVPRD
jgi:hypothetical protein